MSKEPYKGLLSGVVENALLHLYLEVSHRGCYVSRVKRNEILVRFLKPKIKASQYKRIKSELKIMVNIARNREGDLEAKLIELQRMGSKHREKNTDAHALFELIEHLEKDHNFTSKMYSSKLVSIPDIVYLIPDHMDNCFAEDGTQIAPISMLIESERAQELARVINQTKLFTAHMKEWNEEKQQAHIQLHPIRNNQDEK